jgi:alkyl hydroperoxide reductase subunit F
LTQKPLPEVLDTIIVGAGPAGMSACVYAARRKLKTLLLCGKIGGTLQWHSRTENATGVTKAVAPGVLKMFEDHRKIGDQVNSEIDLWVHEHEKVQLVEKNRQLFEVSTEKNTSYLTKTLIIASGRTPKKLDIRGEKEAIRGNGMSQANSSDAPIYRNKKMVVIGGGDNALDVAIQLTKLTSDITILTDLHDFQASPELIEQVIDEPKITIIQGVAILQILLGDNNKVCGVEYGHNGIHKTIDCEGIFKDIGSYAETLFVKNFLLLTEDNEIRIDRECRTEYPGLFAAGNCTNTRHKQAIVSLGFGAVAALEAHRFIVRSGDYYADVADDLL